MTDELKYSSVSFCVDTPLFFAKFHRYFVSVLAKLELNANEFVIKQ